MVDALSVGSEEASVDIGEPDNRGEKNDGGDLLKGLHPCSGAREDACPRGLEAKQKVRSSKAECERREDREGNPAGLREGEADGCSHEGRGARCGDDGCEDSGEEAAGVTLLLREFATDTGEREADVE